MKKLFLLVVLFSLLGTGISRGTNIAVDVSGTWSLSVDLEDGGHGDPTFVFKQDKEALTGSYDGPLGQHNISGSVKENKVVFGFEFTNEGETRKVSYTGTIESATKMSGTMEISGGPKGKWTGTKK